MNEALKVSAAVYNLFDEEVLPDEFNTVVEGRRVSAGVTASF